MAGFRLTDEESGFLTVKPFVVLAAHSQRYVTLMQFDTEAEYQAELTSTSDPDEDAVTDDR